jgi:TRAP-type transport system periplasmic protein
MKNIRIPVVAIGALFFCAMILMNVAETPAEQLVLRHGDLISPRNASYQSMLAWSECVEKATKGRIKIEHFWSAQLGGQRQHTKSLMAGTLDFNYSGLAVIAGFDPRFELGSLPFLFDTNEEYEKYVVNGWIGELEKKYLLEKGLRILAFSNPGLTWYYSVKPIKKVSDLKGMKLRIQESPMYLHYFKGLGVIPTPVPWGEIYTGLQTKTFDGLYSNLDWVMAYKFHEAVDYVVPLYTNYLDTAWMISEKTWQNKLSPEDREAMEQCSECYHANERSAFNMSQLLRREELKKLGKNTEEMPAKERAKLRKLSIKIIEPYVRKVWGNDIWDRLNNEIYSKK